MASIAIFLVMILASSIISYSIADEALKTLQGCPALDINSHILLKKKPAAADEDYIKLLFDIDFIYTLLPPHICDEEKARFNELRPSDKEQTRIFFPSALWLLEKQLYLAAARVSILNSYSYVYLTFFDSDWNEVRNTDFVGKTQVPSIITLGKMKNELWWGPEDPRLFRALSNEIFFIATLMEGHPNFNRQINLYRFSTATYRKLELQEHNGKTWRVEKNWSPLIVDNEHLYFLYKYEDTQVIDCTEEHLPCKRRFGSDKGSSRTFGSSPYIRFLNTNYFISFAQTKYDFIKPHHRPALSIIQALEGGDFKIIYMSEPLNFPSTQLANPKWIKTKFSGNDIRRIMMVTSIANLDFQSGIADLLVSLDDEIAVVVKVDGLKDFVQYVINVYEYVRLPEENNCADKLGEEYFRSLPQGVFIDNYS